MTVSLPFTREEIKLMQETIRGLLKPPAFSPNRWFVSPLNFAKGPRSKMKLPKKVQISDITLREGQQTAGSYVLSMEDQIALAKALDELGVDMIQVGTHISSAAVQEELRRIARLDLKAKLVTCVTSLEEVDIAAKCGADIVEFFTAPAPSLQAILGGRAKTTKDQIERGIAFVNRASKHGIMVRADINYAALAPIGFVKRYFRAVADAGAAYLHIADSTGMMGTPALRYLVAQVRKTAPRTPLGVHCHNDFGLGTANALAAVEEGAEVVDVVIGGLGERAGLSALAEVALALESLYRVETGLRLEKLEYVHKLYAGMAHYPIPANKPVVGENAFSNTIELHAMDEFIDPWLATPIKPEVVGNRKRYYLGKYSGIFSLLRKMEEMGISADDEKIHEIYEETMRLMRQKGFVSDNDLRELVASKVT